MKVFKRLSYMVSLVLVLMLLATSSASARKKKTIFVSTDETLTTVSFATTHGVIRVNFPNDIHAGDTISGIIQIQSKGTSKSSKRRYEKKLNQYIVNVGDYEAYVRIGTYRLKVPKDASNLSIGLSNYKGKLLGSENIKVMAAAQSKVPTEYKSSKCVEANQPIKIKGEFTGDYRLTKVEANGRPGLILAESPRSIVFLSPDNIIGEMKVDVKEGKKKYTAKLFALSVSTSMVTRSIARGKSHSLLVRLSGMNTEGPSVMVKLRNLTPSIVNLEGGDVQSVGAKSDTGTWEVRREVHGQKLGQFRLKARLLPSRHKVKFKTM